MADASHELRTPLASIRGYTELIAREGADADLPERATHALGRVHSESVRMTALVEDLLLLARLDAGRELRREEVDLVGLLVDTVADARAAGPDHEWALELTALEPPAGPAGELSDRRPRPGTPAASHQLAGPVDAHHVHRHRGAGQHLQRKIAGRLGDLVPKGDSGGGAGLDGGQRGGRSGHPGSHLGSRPGLFGQPGQ